MDLNEQFTQNAKKLFSELQEYLQLEKRFAMLTIAEKLTIVLSVAIILLVIVLLSAQVVMYLMLAFAELVGSAVGSRALGYLAAAVLVAALAILFYAMRTRWVVNPLARLMSHLFDNSGQK